MKIQAKVRYIISETVKALEEQENDEKLSEEGREEIRGQKNRAIISDLAIQEALDAGDIAKAKEIASNLDDIGGRPGDGFGHDFLMLDVLKVLGEAENKEREVKKIQELQNEIDNIQMRMDAILVVSDNTVPTTCEAGAKFELQSSVSEFNAVMFLTSYFGRIQMERSDDCVGFYTDLGHVGTYSQNKRTLYFGGTRTKDGVKDSFVW